MKKKDILTAIADRNVAQLRALLDGAPASTLSAPLVLAAAVGPVETVRALLEASADPNASVPLFARLAKVLPGERLAEDVESWTPLLAAAAGGNPEILQSLIAAGAVIETAEEEETPLIVAIEANQASAVQTLIAAGADVHAHYDLPPVAAAGRIGNTAIVRELLKAGADLNARSVEGRTALMEAARAGHLELCQFLLANGARADIEDNEGLLAADDSASDEIRELMLAPLPVDERQARTKESSAPPKSASVDRLIEFIFSAKLEEAQALIASGEVDINSVGETGFTPLARAVGVATHWKRSSDIPKGTPRERVLAMVDLLISSGADLGLTPPHHLPPIGHANDKVPFFKLLDAAMARSGGDMKKAAKLLNVTHKALVKAAEIRAKDPDD